MSFLYFCIPEFCNVDPPADQPRGNYKWGLPEGIVARTDSRSENDLARRELEVQQTLANLKSMDAKAAAAAQAKAAEDEFVMQKRMAMEEREASIRCELEVRATLTRVQGMELADAKTAKESAEGSTSGELPRPILD